MTERLGLSGRIAAYFQAAQITPLLALVVLLLGVTAVLVTPREEEPQINVTMANVFIPFPGASVRDVEQMVTTPAEQVLSQITGVEHVMSISKPGVAVLAVQFKVGVPRIEALVRLYDVVNANADWLPRGLGVGQPLIKPKGIDDVPIVALTLYARDRCHRSAGAGARGPQPGDRPQACARHARGGHARRPRPCRAGGARSAAHGQRRRHRGGAAPGAAGGQHGRTRGRAAGRQPLRGGRGGAVSARCPGGGRAGGRRAQRQAHLPAGGGDGPRGRAARETLCVARRRAVPSRPSTRR